MTSAKPAPVSGGEVTAGEFFAVLLLMALPTSLNEALAHYATNGNDLEKALKTALAQAPADTDAARTYQALIHDWKNGRFAALFQQMLKRDNIEALAKVSNAALIAFNSTNTGLVKWDSPPHPGGHNVAKLMSHLKGFEEAVAT